MTHAMLDKLSTEYYTTEQVAQAVGRKTEQWLRIRFKYVAKYNLAVIKIGRRYYYSKETVDPMIEALLCNGD